MCRAQIHVADGAYEHETFRPWRLQALIFKALRRCLPEEPLWREFEYEYAFGRLPIDVINGGPALREWVDDPEAEPGDLDAMARVDESAWRERTADLLLY